jgi:hypothetical protein
MSLGRLMTSPNPACLAGYEAGFRLGDGALGNGFIAKFRVCYRRALRGQAWMDLPEAQRGIRQQLE